MNLHGLGAQQELFQLLALNEVRLFIWTTSTARLMKGRRLTDTEVQFEKHNIT